MHEKTAASVCKVLPAYAGMILRVVDPQVSVRSAPRIRGDDPMQHINVINFVACSPHTRG